MKSFYEFFAGGGMARAGLGDGWNCTFANDFDRKKATAYVENWGVGGEFRVADILDVIPNDLPNQADLVWGSFPCQDLSLAGRGAGLNGKRSGTFYPFWRLMEGLLSEGRSPCFIALENVTGTLTSHSGADFVAVCEKFSDLGYRYGAVVVDAKLFVPQSRPRLFFVGIRSDLRVDNRYLSPDALEPFHTKSLQNAVARIPLAARRSWLWWNLPTPPHRRSSFSELLQDSSDGLEWHSSDQTQALIEQMSPLNLAKLEAAKRAGRRMVGTVYRRMRPTSSNGREVRAEVRFDDIAGCLRTPVGGSSRQTIIVVEGKLVQSRLISARETARLMGLPEAYRLPKNYTEAYHLTGDGVAVPVVRFLAEYIFEPILDGRGAS